MPLGYYIDQNTINGRAVQASVNLRMSFDLIETMAAFLSTRPIVDDVDPLVTKFNYTPEEATLMRDFFESWESVRVANQPLFNTARLITGLE